MERDLYNFRDFTSKDLFLNPSKDPELPYRRRKEEAKKNVHWGQRKLLLTLVQFLSLFWKKEQVLNPVVVYAGAAPGTNIAIVSSFFPDINFHLYDPAPFKIKETDKIKLYQQYFTNEDAKRWSGRSDVFFISDIRSVDYTKSENLDENEKGIMKDMQMQMDWFNIIDPVHGQLKFRPPYTGGNRPERINYLYGYVFKQPWAPQTSTETRLVPVKDSKGKWRFASWSSGKYQDQLFYHNVMIREKFKYKNPFKPSNPTAPIDDPELLNDWDSRAEVQILVDYLNFTGTPVTEKYVIALSRLITDKLTANSKRKFTINMRRLQTSYHSKNVSAKGRGRSNLPSAKSFIQ